jgi:nitric oxide reductase NorD protein
MFDFLELEETVGKAWHRLVGGRISYPTHPDQAVTLDEVRGHLSVIFRALGGEFGVQLAGVSPRSSSHRLRLGQRLGLAEERLAQPGRDVATLFLPPCSDLFPSRSLNEALYRWLAAYFAHLPVEPIAEPDPLRRDLLSLRRAAATVDAVLASCPGLARTYADLRLAMTEARPRRSLPDVEVEVEEIVVAVLAGFGPVFTRTDRRGFRHGLETCASSVP